MAKRFFKLSALRAERLTKGLKLADVARTAGLSMAKSSMIERDLAAADAEDIRALRRAIRTLSETA